MIEAPRTIGDTALFSTYTALCSAFLADSGLKIPHTDKVKADLDAFVYAAGKHPSWSEVLKDEVEQAVEDHRHAVKVQDEGALRELKDSVAKMVGAHDPMHQAVAISDLRMLNKTHYIADLPIQAISYPDKALHHGIPDSFEKVPEILALGAGLMREYADYLRSGRASSLHGKAVCVEVDMIPEDLDQLKILMVLRMLLGLPFFGIEF